MPVVSLGSAGFGEFGVSWLRPCLNVHRMKGLGGHLVNWLTAAAHSQQYQYHREYLVTIL